MYRVLWVVILVLAVAICAFGQAGGTGSIEGQVLDQGGALIPEVTVTAVNTATQIVTTAVTNSVGNYALLRLQPGTYTLSIEHSGFKKLERTGVLVVVSIWDSQEDMMAARDEMMRFRQTFDFRANQEGPTRYFQGNAEFAEIGLK